MTLRRLRSALMTAILALGLIAGAASMARAADPVSVSLSEVSVAGSTITGALTVRSKSAVQVDLGSLTASVDGKEMSVSITQTAKVQRRAMLVIDTSGSMGFAGMATVRTAVSSYLTAVPADVLVGVVSFANTAGVDLAPTPNRAAVQRVVNGLVARGNTALYGGITAATKALGSNGDLSLVLLSDGADTVAADEPLARAQTTQALKAAGIRVDVVRFKSDDPDAARALTGFAGVNGGTVVSADNTAAVVAAFKASAKALESQVPFAISLDEALNGNHTVELKGLAGGTPFTVSRVVSFAAVQAVPKPQATAKAGVTLPDVPSVAPQSWWPMLAALLVGVALFALGGASLIPTLKTKREQRVGAIESYVVGPKLVSRSEGKAHAQPLSDQLTALGEKAMEGRKATSWLLANIERADLPFRAGDWFVLTVAASVSGAALGFLLLRALPALGTFFGFVVGFVLPQAALKFLAVRRSSRFESILPDVLMLVATSLRSGFGLLQALDGVARDAAEPAAKEFSRALAETRIGTDIADALERASERMGSTSLRWTVMAIRIQREVGGNLAETLLTTASTLRERESLHRQVRALSAEGRISAYILLALPGVLVLFMTAINYDYISLLWTTGLGILMILGSLILFAIGIVWMRKLVRIEV